MKRIFSLLGLLFCIILIVGCHKDNLHTANGSKRVWHEHTIAVILPMNSGMNLHWKRTLEWVSRNLESAFVNQEEGVRLRYEWYDENSADLAALAKQLSRRDDIEAVIGGVKSVNAQIMAPIFTKYKKIFFTLATNSNLIRAYSDSTLWAMTESDITLCEILLSKVVSYKGKSVRCSLATTPTARHLSIGSASRPRRWSLSMAAFSAMTRPHYRASANKLLPPMLTM